MFQNSNILKERIKREKKSHTENDVLAANYKLKLKFPHILEYPSRNRLYQLIDKFDIVIGHAILHHLDPSIALDEVFRVFKPCGRVLLQEPLANNLLLRLFRLLTPHARTKNERPFSGKDINRFISQNRWDSKVVYCGLMEAPVSIFTSLVLPKKPDNAIIRFAD